MKKSKVIMLIGLLLMAMALFLTVYNRIESRSAKYYSESIIQAMDEQIPDSGNTVAEEVSEDVLAEFSMRNMPVMNIDGDRYIGYLSIPDIELRLPVIQELREEALKKAPCRYSGSVYTRDMVIAGHNYRSHFRKIRSLPLGTQIQFVDVEGNSFGYEIVDIEVLDGNEVEAMQAGQWDLTLFTCNYDGQARVTLRCELINLKFRK